MILGLLLPCLMFLSGLSQADPPHPPPANFTLPGSHGETIRLSDYRGRWVIVNFWATWCGPCIREIPELRAFHRAHKDRDALVIGVNFEQIPLDRLQAFLERYAIDYPIALVGETPLLPFEPLKGLPSTFIVDPEGRLVHRHVGSTDQTRLEEILNTLKNAG